MHLIAEFQLIFDGIFDGADVALVGFHFAQGRVQCRAFARTGGPGDQQNAVGQRDLFAELLADIGFHAGLVEAPEDRGAVQEPHDDLFAVAGGQDRDAQVDGAAAHADGDLAILGNAPLGNVEIGHDLHARDEGRVHLVGDLPHVEEHAVDPVADLGVFFLGLDMNVAGALAEGVGQQEIDILDDGRFAGGFFEVAEILLELLDDFDLVQIVHHVIHIVVEPGVVELVGDRLDVGVGADHDADLQVGLSLDVVKGEDIGRPAGGHHQRAIAEGDGHDMVGLDVVRGQLVEGGAIDLLGGNLAEFETVQPRLGLQDILGQNADGPDELIDIAAALLLLFLADLVELGRRQLAHLEQDIGDIADMGGLIDLRGIEIAQARGQLAAGRAVEFHQRPGIGQGHR